MNDPKITGTNEWAAAEALQHSMTDKRERIRGREFSSVCGGIQPLFHWIEIRDDDPADLDALIGAVKQWSITGSVGFATCNSGDEYQVVIKFKTLKEAQEHYSAMANLGKALEPK